MEELCGSAHALLGDQQDNRTDDQDRAEDIEDGGADAAGAGQLGAGLVLDFNLPNVGCILLEGMGHLRTVDGNSVGNLNLDRTCQLIVAVRSLGLFQVVGVSVKAFDRNLAVSIRDKLGGLRLLLSPAGQLSILIR